MAASSLSVCKGKGAPLVTLSPPSLVTLLIPTGALFLAEELSHSTAAHHLPFPHELR